LARQKATVLFKEQIVPDSPRRYSVSASLVVFPHRCRSGPMRVSIVCECVAREVEWVRVISEVDVQYFYRGSRIARKEICVKIHVAFRPLKIDRGFVWTAGVRNTEEDIVHNPDLAHSAQHHCCRSG